MTDAPPPGWYQDPEGTTRWWDGTQWGAAAPPAGSAPSPPAPPIPGGQNVQAPAQPFAVPQDPLDPGVAFSFAWKKFAEHWQSLVSIVVVVALVNFAAILIAFIALIPALSGGTTSAVIGWTLFIVATAAAAAVGFVVQAGVYRAGLAVTSGVAPRLGMLVETTNLGTYIGTALLVGLGATIGTILCVLPGLAVVVFCSYAPLIALDKGLGPVDAIRRSIELVRNNLGQVLLILLLAYAVYYVGSLACYIGLVASIPVALIMITYSYRVLEGEPVSA